MGFFDRKKVKKPPRAASTSLPPQQQPGHPSSQASLPDYHLPHPPSTSFQPAGYLPGPQGWNNGPPVIVNQHYYLSPPPDVAMVNQRPCLGNSGLARLTGSMVNLASGLIPSDLPRFADDSRLHWPASQCNTYDHIMAKFDSVMSSIDQDHYAGGEGELLEAGPSLLADQKKHKSAHPTRDQPKGQTTAVASSIMSGSYFAKVDLYSNSRLPTNLPPLRLYDEFHFPSLPRYLHRPLDSYIPTWPLLCLAAQYSERVYNTPRGTERTSHVSSDWRNGTKAMVIKSVPMDSVGTIVFAIRGTATFMDWAVNLQMAPAAPTGFLDDSGNLCHAGFLATARKMVRPVAARLRQLLEEDPGRARYSLLITGHSAGGAVASLLYSHMLATTAAARSELNCLAGAFKRVHCVTFGTPPVSLLPLAKPDKKELKKSLFLSFVNEGDPVARADKAYVKSLLELFAAPAPIGLENNSSHSLPSKSRRKEKSSRSSTASHKSKSSGSSKKGPLWSLPQSTLSNAGRVVVLRSGDPKAKGHNRKTVEERLNEGVVAQIATDEQLREVIWGDPVCHVMRLYAGRVEILAVAAVTARH
jgi:hypothetical protein